MKTRVRKSILYNQEAYSYRIRTNPTRSNQAI